MKLYIPFFSTFILCLFTSIEVYSQQDHLDVEGNVKIRGHLDINHKEDTTSIFIGQNAGLNSDFSTERRNTFLGAGAGIENTFGRENSFFGFRAGFKTTIGVDNTFFGQRAGTKNTSGMENSFFGANVGTSNTTGFSNSFFGYEAGTATAKGTRLTFIGQRADRLFGSPDSLDRATAIGINAKVGCSNCLVLGGTGPDSVNVGIGTSNPSVTLDVKGIATFENGGMAGGMIKVLGLDGSTAAMRLYEGDDFGFELQYEGSSDKLHLWSRKFLSNEDIRMTWQKDGRVGIGTTTPSAQLHTTTPSAQLHTTGTVRLDHFGAGSLQTDADGNLSVSSDIRLKKNISSYEKGLGEVLNLEPIAYNWVQKSGMETESQYVGFSAQNVQSSIPEAVSLDKRGYLTLSDRPILAALVNSVKELNNANIHIISEYKAKILAQEAQISKLQEQVSEFTHLKQEMAELKMMMTTMSNQAGRQE